MPPTPGTPPEWCTLALDPRTDTPLLRTPRTGPGSGPQPERGTDIFAHRAASGTVYFYLWHWTVQENETNICQLTTADSVKHYIREQFREQCPDRQPEQSRRPGHEPLHEQPPEKIRGQVREENPDRNPDRNVEWNAERNVVQNVVQHVVQRCRPGREHSDQTVREQVREPCRAGACGWMPVLIHEHLMEHLPGLYRDTDDEHEPTDR